MRSFILIVLNAQLSKLMSFQDESSNFSKFEVFFPELVSLARFQSQQDAAVVAQ